MDEIYKQQIEILKDIVKTKSQTILTLKKINQLSKAQFIIDMCDNLTILCKECDPNGRGYEYGNGYQDAIAHIIKVLRNIE